MRIISGTLKGRRFSPPKSFSARPTTDVARESLFNVLNNRLDFSDLKALDLFGGTGSISYELASRGCADVTTIELNYKHYSFIKSMIKEFALERQMNVLKGDVFKFISRCHDKFDMVFADPPFDLPIIESIPDLFFEQDLLTEDGFFIMEHSDKKSFESHPNFTELRKYGKVHFSFFEKK